MPAKRILIVDDQRDIRQLLRNSLESIRLDVQIVDVPSGEEAMLVISRQKFDLLVSDVRLAGMSGLELVSKVRQRNPGLKVILITGLTDSEVRQQVADFGAEAFFYKPVDIAEFQAKVAGCLGEGRVEPAEVDRQQVEPPVEQISPLINVPRLAEYLARLRQELNASCVWMIDSQGELLLQAGELPGQWHSPEWRASVIAARAACAIVMRSAKAGGSSGYLYFGGEEVDLHLVSLDRSLALLATTPQGQDRSPSSWMEQLLQARREVVAALEGASPTSPVKSPEVGIAEQEERIDTGELVALDKAFQQVMVEPVDTQQADEFWDALAQGSGEGSTPANNSLNYEQARKLGLAPEE
jgi:CheY-like chemotaxis protein